MPTSVLHGALIPGDEVTTLRRAGPRRSTRVGTDPPIRSVHIESMPTRLAMSITLPTPSFSVSSKNGTFRDATVASTSVQLGWQPADVPLRTGPAGDPFVRPLFGNSF